MPPLLGWLSLVFCSSRLSPGAVMNGAPIDLLLERLANVHQSGKGWRAACPSHGSDRNQSLSIAAADNGLVLLHCFTGCEPLDVLGAIGLELSDLFPERISDYSPKGRRAAAEFRTLAGWKAALSVLCRESNVIAIAAVALRVGDDLTDADRERLSLACDRVADVREVLV